MDDRMTALDAGFLHVEDAVSHMHIGSVGIFEGPAPRYEEVLAKISSKLDRVPRYRQVVKRSPVDVLRPVWVDDPHFNLEYHIRHSALPAPGGEEELRRLVGRVMSQQLDRSKPLWEIWVVDGLEADRWALLSKVHHCMVDGVSGAELLSVILDLTPDATEPAETAAWVPRPAPSTLELAVRSMRDLAAHASRPDHLVRAAVRLPREASAQLGEAARGLATMLGAARPTPTSSLNGPIGPHRRWGWAIASVDDIKQVRASHGGTFNDVVLACVAAGFRELLISRGESADRIVRAMVPVSVRARDERGVAVGDGQMSNRISVLFADLPVGETDPIARLAQISSQMQGLKDSHEAMAGEALTSISGFAPPVLLSLGVRVASKGSQRAINTVTTNVPGPQLPLYLLGRKMLQALPFVPLGIQMRFGIAAFSYDGQVAFGVTADYDAAPDVGVMCRGIEKGLADLLAIA